MTGRELYPDIGLVLLTADYRIVGVNVVPVSPRYHGDPQK